VEVRSATTADLPAIVCIGHEAWRDSYGDLLDTTTIDRYLSASYSLDGICTRLDDHPIFVAADADHVAAFADIIMEPDRIIVAEICTIDEWRRHGLASKLIDEAQQLGPDLPVSADVVLGNQAAECFYEQLGFVPGETVQIDFFGQHVVQRRWWRVPDHP
jgi:GNAT superfamily N-acetyltransferase